MALQKAAKAAIKREIKREGPAIPAAGAITEKIPAPRIAASPVDAASNRLSWGLRVGFELLPPSPLASSSSKFGMKKEEKES